ncbi:hypothetical protein [[Enterobacter] lignolyticus]|uniref:Uncharacterized protein n=1 Tax=[Enterobacter] lignolyticus TaxID=1334193 RepID=A0A806X990_9ENTR|nr:hypothetical protein [[Enterobacter] lignolyticus]ALR78135.1 hypothetical protein AO703_18190 [[Enterobacter] lignolyticus]
MDDAVLHSAGLDERLRMHLDRHIQGEIPYLRALELAVVDLSRENRDMKARLLEYYNVQAGGH